MKKKNTLAQSKLLILYFLNAAGLRLSEFQLMRVMSEKNLINYFDLKEALFELCETGLLSRVETKEGLFYTITAAGREALEFFKSDLRLSIRNELSEYCEQMRRALSLETETFADYIQIKEGEFRVTLRITEQYSNIFELNVVVCSRADAERIVEGWSGNASMIYQDVILNL